MQYTNHRGNKSDTIPYGLLSQEEREEILGYYLEFGSKETVEMFNISRQTLEHIKFHNKGEVLERVEDRNFKKKGL